MLLRQAQRAGISDRAGQEVNRCVSPAPRAPAPAQPAHRLRAGIACHHQRAGPQPLHRARPARHPDARPRREADETVVIAGDLVRGEEPRCNALVEIVEEPALQIEIRGPDHLNDLASGIGALEHDDPARVRRRIAADHHRVLQRRAAIRSVARPGHVVGFPELEQPGLRIVVAGADHQAEGRGWRVVERAGSPGGIDVAARRNRELAVDPEEFQCHAPARQAASGSRRSVVNSR